MTPAHPKVANHDVVTRHAAGRAHSTELSDEPRLADSGLAAHVDGLTQAFIDTGIQNGAELIEFAPPPHEGRVCPRGYRLLE